MWLNTETEVTQDLRPQPVAQTDVLEPNHVPLRRAAANTHSPSAPESTLYSNAHRVGVDDLFLASAASHRGQEPALWFPFGFRSVNERPASVQESPLAGANRRC